VNGETRREDQPLITATEHAGGAEAHIEAVNLVKTYPARQRGIGNVHALGPISFTLSRSEFFAVVGPSGCGKSTLLDVMAGLTAKSSGTILFEGGEVAGGTVPDGVGIVFQDDASFSWLNVYDNIAFGLRRMGKDAAEIRRRVDHALKLMGLTEFVHAYPAQLSGGMRQRMCIARTLVLEPRMIFLDEPFGALDQQTRLLMGDELLRLWRETGASIMLITHALDEAAMLADRVGVMSARPGKFLDVISTGWPRSRTSEIISHPDFGGITARIWSTLRSESLKSMSQQTDA
jgi:NitT/TauT family transport system ATP-binding protein